MKRMLLLITALIITLTGKTFAQSVTYAMQNSTNCTKGVVNLYAVCKGTCSPVYTLSYTPPGIAATGMIKFFTEGSAGSWFPTPQCSELEVIAVDILDCNTSTIHQIGELTCGYNPNLTMNCNGDCGGSIPTTIYVNWLTTTSGGVTSPLIQFHY